MKRSDPNSSRLSLVLSKEEHKVLKKLSVDDSTSIQELGVQAIRDLIVRKTLDIQAQIGEGDKVKNTEVVCRSADVTTTSSAQIEKRAELYSMLDEILASGIEVFVKGLTYNLQAWAVALRAMENNESGDSDTDKWQRLDADLNEVEATATDAEKIARRNREDRERNRGGIRGIDSGDGDGDGSHRS